jgi:hypothetical protein
MTQLSRRSLYVFFGLWIIFALGIANQALSNPKTDSQSKVTFYVH